MDYKISLCQISSVAHWIPFSLGFLSNIQIEQKPILAVCLLRLLCFFFQLCPPSQSTWCHTGDAIHPRLNAVRTAECCRWPTCARRAQLKGSLSAGPLGLLRRWMAGVSVGGGGLFRPSVGERERRCSFFTALLSVWFRFVCQSRPPHLCSEFHAFRWGAERVKKSWSHNINGGATSESIQRSSQSKTAKKNIWRYVHNAHHDTSNINLQEIKTVRLSLILDVYINVFKLMSHGGGIIQHLAAAWFKTEYGMKPFKFPNMRSRLQRVSFHQGFFPSVPPLNWTTLIIIHLALNSPKPICTSLLIKSQIFPSESVETKTKQVSGRYAH